MASAFPSRPGGVLKNQPKKTKTAAAMTRYFDAAPIRLRVMMGMISRLYGFQT
jgi:hypothetical protein